MTVANVYVQQVLLRRGNTAAVSAYTGPVGEVIVDTGLDTLRVQDGITPGGFLIASQQYVDSSLANVVLGGNVDLGSYATISFVNNRVDTISNIGNIAISDQTISGMNNAHPLIINFPETIINQTATFNGLITANSGIGCLPTTTTDTGTIVVRGGVGVSGNIYLGTDADGRLQVGTGGELLPNVLGQFSSNVNSYAQVNMQNLRHGPLASSDFVATADNGDDSSFFIDMGIASSVYDFPDYQGYKPNDGYLLVNGGNLLLNTDTTGKSIKMMVGGHAESDVVGQWTTSGLVMTGNIIPSANITYSLGDAGHWWKDIWVGSNTIYMNGIPVRLNGNTLVVGNGVDNTLATESFVASALASIDQSSLVNGIYTATLGTDGNISVPGSIIPNSDILQDLGSPTNRFRHLYVGPGSITVGNAVITTTLTGNLILPGLTKAVASSSFVEEVNDTGHQTYSFNDIPTVIDAAYFEYLNGTSISGFSTAVYEVNALDGEGFIDGISVLSGGSGYVYDVADYASTEMYATEVVDPFLSFDPNVWIRIPFNARIRAGESEYEFSTGGTSGIIVGEIDSEDQLTNDTVVTAIGFSQSDGFTVTELDGGIMKISVTGGGSVDLTTINANITNLWSNAAAQANSLSTLTSNAAVQASSIATLTSNAAAQATSINTLTSNAASQATFINTLISNTAAAHSEIDGLRANITAANLAIAAIQTGSGFATVTQLAANISTVTAEWTANAASQQIEIDGLISNAATQASSIISLTSNAATQQTSINTLFSDIAAANLTIINSNSQMKSYVDNQITTISLTPGPKGDTGAQGVSVTLLGNVTAPENLPLTGNVGEAWIVNSTGNLWFWNTTISNWGDIGPIVGPKGDQGIQGNVGPAGPGANQDLNTYDSVTFAGVYNSGLYTAGQGIPTLGGTSTAGYSFNVGGEYSEGSYDTGMFSQRDGIVSLWSNARKTLETTDTDVSIFTQDAGYTSTNEWHFDRYGNLTLPINSGGIFWSNGSAYSNPLVSASSLVNGMYEVVLNSDGTTSIPAEGLVFPNGSFIRQKQEEGLVFWQTETDGDANDAEYIGLWYGGDAVNSDSPNVSITAGSYNFAVDDGNLEYLYYTNTGADQGTYQINLDIVSPTTGNILNWHFDTSGNLYLPADPAVRSTSGIVFGDGTVQTTASGDSSVIVSATAPDVANGKLWFNSTDARTYVRYNNQWVDTSPTVIPHTSTYTGELVVEETTISNTDYTGAKDITIENGESQYKFTSIGELVLPSRLDFTASPAVQTAGIVFGDNTKQTTAWTGTILELDGGDAGSWLTAL